jgi:outer membrane receptor protein involved in Fe transport
MTTKSLFLYLEDGIPIRTTGLYNHNALLEMNLASVKNIEVIKGPSSSLYGSEAIGGVVNFITLAPSAIPVLKLSAQGNTIGYKRADLIHSGSAGKLGWVLSGYYANRRNGYLEYTDFNKATLTARIDYRFSETTQLTNSVSYLNYRSDMAGGIDSAMFAAHSFSNPQTFTYRAVNALRYHSTLSHAWSDKGKSTLTALYRKNTIDQNPAYRVKDDYRRVGSVFVGSKELAHGEINASTFNSYALIAQHRQSLAWKKAVVIAGASAELSPSRYRADYIRIKKDTVTGKYISYQPVDSVLTSYATDLNNYAAFLNVEASPWEKLRLVASLRYDYFRYGFDNSLRPSAFSGSPDTVSHFQRLSPKLGFTYNVSASLGFYANYSEGFVPPQVTELYTGVRVPDLDPSVFYNYEAGGWMALIRNRLSADISMYRLIGTNEIISVKQNDGSFVNQNAGRTSHQGIELGIKATPLNEITFRFSGAFSKHRFEEFREKGTSYNGNEMNNAPHWIYNAEVWYKPEGIAGLRLGIEWQHVGSYFADPQNTARYKGYNVLNARMGYRHKAMDVWINVLNATDSYYSYITSKSASGYSYQLAEPLNVNIGLGYDLAALFTK